MLKIESMADKIADAVLAELTDHSGFDAFWAEIDSSIRREIREAIGLNALEAMREPTVEMQIVGDRQRIGASPTKIYTAMIDAAIKDGAA